MLFPRTKLVERFQELFHREENQYIAIVWEEWIGKSSFLDLLRTSDLFVTSTVESIFLDSENTIESIVSISPEINLIIIDSNSTVLFSDIRTFIESYSPDSRVIFTSEMQIESDIVENFALGGISFREYTEGMWQSIDVGAIMSGGVDITSLNILRDTYIHLGQYPKNLIDSDHVFVSFDDKIALMNTELFKKEEWDFLDFIRTLAMNIGDIYKEERIAKNMNISRRKVRKYTEVALKYGVIRAIGPWVENAAVELSRHVKVYFTDLAYFHAALWVGYYLGEGKQGVIENFILIELDRKLSETHDIRFYRKKSGSEVSFILIEKLTDKITPIEVTTKSTDIIPQSLKSFHEAYGSRIEHTMILNDMKSEQKDINGTPVIIIPHIAI